MKSNFVKTLVLPFTVLLMFINPNSLAASDRMERLDLELNSGARYDELDWNISGNLNGGDPNILSELTWEELEIYEVNTKARLIMTNNKVPFGGTAIIRAGYGEIQSGLNQDSDYRFDNRVGEWSRTSNQADRGDVFDFTTGLGLVFRSRNGVFMISPLAGYSHHAQNLTIHDGYQTISRDNPFSTEAADDPPPIGPIEGLNSTYDTDWKSGWIGLDIELRPVEFMEIDGFVELHTAEYRAEANWNLRSDFTHPLSFEHESNDAAGVVAGIGAKIGGDLLLLNLDLFYQKWRAEDGFDIIHNSNGTTSVTRLNEVNWESFSVSAGLTVRF